MKNFTPRKFHLAIVTGSITTPYLVIIGARGGFYLSCGLLGSLTTHTSCIMQNCKPCAFSSWQSRKNHTTAIINNTLSHWISQEACGQVSHKSGVGELIDTSHSSMGIPALITINALSSQHGRYVVLLVVQLFFSCVLLLNRSSLEYAGREGPSTCRFPRLSCCHGS
jgi:hypothetical protein